MRRAGLIVLAVLLLARSAAALEGLQPGMKAPALTLESPDGSRVVVPSALGARASLVVFWATWSNKSAEVLERAEKLARANRERGLSVIGVNVEAPTPTREQLAAVRTTAGRLSFQVAIDRGLEAFHAYGVVAVPSSVLIGADGTVQAVLASYPIAGREEFFESVEAAVGARTARSAAAVAGPAPNPRAVRYFNLGRVAMAQGLDEQAAANMRRAITLDPAFPLPRVLLGRLARERASAHEAVQTAGGTATTLRMETGERNRLLAEAEAVLAEAVRLAPRSASALTELALLHETKGDTTRARELLERATAADASYPVARGHLGALRLTVGETAAGRADLDAAIQLNPLDWRLHIIAAQAYEKQTMLREALAAYRRGVELLWQSRRESRGAR